MIVLLDLNKEMSFSHQIVEGACLCLMSLEHALSYYNVYKLKTSYFQPY